MKNTPITHNHWKDKRHVNSVQKMGNRNVTFTEQKVTTVALMLLWKRLKWQMTRFWAPTILGCVPHLCALQTAAGFFFFLGPTIGEIHQTHMDLWVTSEIKTKTNLQPAVIRHTPVAHFLCCMTAVNYWNTVCCVLSCTSIILQPSWTKEIKRLDRNIQYASWVIEAFHHFRKWVW